jgi:hypothetical protein
VATGRAEGLLAHWLGESLVHIQSEFQRWEGAGGFDEVVGVAVEAGQHMADHRRVRAGGGQVDGMLPIGGAFGQVLGPWPVRPARIVYSSTAPVKVARWPARIPYGCGISDELAQRATACG